ncbi:hypothetical protein OAH18_02990 [bacterium]|nr:hypothetical protein [bacterium]
MKPLFCILVLMLLVLHQDYWQWDRSDLLFGFLPYALAYHMVVSVVTAVFWIVAVKFFWPADVDDVTPLQSIDEASDAQNGVTQ